MRKIFKILLSVIVMLMITLCNGQTIIIKYRTKPLPTLKASLNQPIPIFNTTQNKGMIKGMTQSTHAYPKRFENWYKVKGDKKTLETLNRDINVDTAYFENIYNDTFSPNDSYYVGELGYYQQWYLNNTGYTGGLVGADIQIEDAWDIERGDTNVIVGILENGIRVTHYDLRNNYSGIFKNFWNSETSPGVSWHGTVVTGIISAETDNLIGVAGIANVKFAFFQRGDPATNGSTATDIAAAVIYATDYTPIINCSFGGYDDPLLESALVYFEKEGGLGFVKGGIAIAGAGNDHNTAKFYPAAYPTTISVAGTDQYDSIWLDSWTVGSNYGDWIDVSAPCSLFPAIGYYNDSAYYTTALSGTSWATAMVSGIAALIISKYPGYFTNDEVKQIIINSTDNIDTINPTYAGKLGSGRVNAYKALKEAEKLVNSKMSMF